MPNYFYNSPWQDANEYGAAAGNTLAGAIYGVPRQRYEMALQQRQMQNTLQQHMMQNQIQQQRYQGLNDFHNQMVDWRNRDTDVKAGNAQILNQIRLLQAQEGYNKPIVVPRDASVLQRNQGFGTSGDSGANTNQTENPTGTGGAQSVAPSGQNSLQGYNVMTPNNAPRQPVPATGGQTMNDALKALTLVAGMQKSGFETNNPGLWGATTNLAYPLAKQAGMQFPQSTPQQAQPMPAAGGVPQSNAQSTNGLIIRRYNPATGMVE